MSVADIDGSPWSRSVKLLEAADATNDAPIDTARATLTFTDQPEADETVTIGDAVYTYVAALSEDSGDAVPYEVLIGGSAEASRDNLVAAINAAAGEGTTYGTGTEAHPDVTATASSTDAIIVDAVIGTVATTTTDVADASWDVAALASSGVDLSGWLGKMRPEAFAIAAKSVAGSGTMTVTLRLWAYFDGLDGFVPYGANSTAADKGKLNAGTAIAETGTDSIRHGETVAAPVTMRRLYLEVAAIGGTDTAIDAWASYQVPRDASKRGV